MNVTIMPELKALIPQLTVEERKVLFDSICEEGCRDPLTVWEHDGQHILIDGHNRYEICTELGLVYETRPMHFDTLDDVKVWMINNQLGRRNLKPAQRIDLVRHLEPIIAARAKANKQAAGELFGERHSKQEVLQNSGEPLKPIRTDKVMAEMAGVSHDTYVKTKKVLEEAPPELSDALLRGEVSVNAAHELTKLPEHIQRPALQRIKSGEADSVKSAVQAIKLEEKETRKEERRVALGARVSDLTGHTKKYRVIYADPPWRYREENHSKEGDVQVSVLESHYPTLSIEELCQLPVQSICEPDAVLFMWVTSPLLEECFDIIKAWGFKYKTSMVWDKVKHNVGNYVSVRHELLLICTRGACTPDNRRLHDSVQSVERGAHSEKPEVFRNIIDEIYTYGNRIELFRRGDAPDGWDVWGNEAHE